MVLHLILEGAADPSDVPVCIKAMSQRYAGDGGIRLAADVDDFGFELAGETATLAQGLYWAY